MRASTKGRLLACTGSAAAADAADFGASELKQKVLATVRDVQQGLLERETEVRLLPALHRTGSCPLRSSQHRVS